MLIDIEQPSQGDSRTNSPTTSRAGAASESHPLLVVTAASAPPSPRSSEGPEDQGQGHNKGKKQVFCC